MSDAAPLLALRRVSKVYGSGEAAVFALREVDLEIHAGEFVALVGPSGSGKSTCLNLFGCLDRPSAGQCLLGGIDTGSLGNDERALLRRQLIGFVFQGFNLVARTSALENVELPLIYRGISGGRRRALARRALADVGLADREEARPNQLSGGQQQRVAIARALVTSPSVLLADEPTGNLDTARSHELLAFLAALNRERGLTIVMVTHEPDIAAYAGRVVAFRDGRIVEDRAQEAVLAPPPPPPRAEARP